MGNSNLSLCINVELCGHLKDGTIMCAVRRMTLSNKVKCSHSQQMLYIDVFTFSENDAESMEVFFYLCRQSWVCKMFSVLGRIWYVCLSCLWTCVFVSLCPLVKSKGLRYSLADDAFSMRVYSSSIPHTINMIAVCSFSIFDARLWVRAPIRIVNKLWLVIVCYSRDTNNYSKQLNKVWRIW